MRLSKWKIGDIVIARKLITEDGTSQGDHNASFPAPNYIHACKSDRGAVVGIHDEIPTVRFQKTKTATIVRDDEIKYIGFNSKNKASDAFMNPSYKTK